MSKRPRFDLTWPTASEPRLLTGWVKPKSAQCRFFRVVNWSGTMVTSFREIISFFFLQHCYTMQCIACRRYNTSKMCVRVSASRSLPTNMHFQHSSDNITLPLATIVGGVATDTSPTIPRSLARHQQLSTYTSIAIDRFRFLAWNGDQQCDRYNFNQLDVASDTSIIYWLLINTH